MADRRARAPRLASSDAIRIVFLGGLGEIGRNCMAVEAGGGPSGDGPGRRIMLIDCGLMFPDPDMHGIDLVLPDFTYLRENAARIVAVVATHGHEDHVGALQYLLREVPVPVYGSAVTLGLARNRIEEAGLLGSTELRVVADHDRVQIGPFDVEFIPVTHSVPHAHAIAVHTPQGVVLHSGDFKLDLTLSTAAAPISPVSASSPAPRGSAYCSPTRRTPRNQAMRRARRSSAACCARCSPRTRGGA